MSAQMDFFGQRGYVRPFLKWPGGKYRQLERIASLLPKGKRLFEPFVGSGAGFLNTDYDEYCISDINPHLICLYKTLQAAGVRFIDYVESFFVPENNAKDRYCAFRDRFNASGPNEERAALFVYLNRHCFNGLVRYNGNGKFNVPFGKYDKPYFPRREMQAFHDRAKRAVFACADFRKAMPRATMGDVVYADPPYVPLSETSNFTTYAGKAFLEGDQKDLARLAPELSGRGVPVLVSNHDTSLTREMYRGANISSFSARRSISCKGAERKPAQELLALFLPAS